MNRTSLNSSNNSSRQRNRTRSSLTFNADEVHQLIESVKARPVLWNSQHSQYSFRPTRREQWNIIASRIFRNKFSVEAVQTKWDNLRIQFRHNHLKTLSNNAVVARDPSWRFYSSLLFLTGMDNNGDSNYIETESNTVSFEN